MKTICLEVTDLFKGAFLLCMGGKLEQVRIRTNGRRIATFLITGPDIDRLDSDYRCGRALSVRPALICDPYNQHLFLTLRGKRFSKNMVWELIKKYAIKAKIKKNLSPHTFRHTCATAMLRNKADIVTIQKLLGHSSLDTTQIYTHLSITDLKNEHKRCHPREKDTQ